MKKLEDKNPKSEDGTTPLHNAAKNGHLEAFKTICSKVKEKSPKDDTGKTPFDYAYEKKHWGIIGYFGNVMKKEQNQNENE